MDEQEKDLKEQAPDAVEPEESHTEHHDRLKETTDKIWGSTKHVWSTASFKAIQYKKLVQKKIDQSALHKKINAAHADLGKMIDDLREDGKKNLMNLPEIKEILARIDELKAESVALEEEVEKIRTEELAPEPPQAEEPEVDKNE